MKPHPRCEANGGDIADAHMYLLPFIRDLAVYCPNLCMVKAPGKALQTDGTLASSLPVLKDRLMFGSLCHSSIAGLVAARGAGRHRLLVMASRGMAMSPEERAQLLAKSWTAVASNYERLGFKALF